MMKLEGIFASLGKAGGIEKLLEDISWKDFEGFVAEALSANGFLVRRNLRFSSGKRRHEVDVVGIQKPRVLLVDCKHWSMRRGKASGIQRAAAQQYLRTKSIAGKLPEIFPEMAGWGRAVTIPALVTLHQEAVASHGGAYIVPISKLNSFIEEARCGYYDTLAFEIPSLLRHMEP